MKALKKIEQIKPGDAVYTFDNFIPFDVLAVINKKEYTTLLLKNGKDQFLFKGMNGRNMGILQENK